MGKPYSGNSPSIVLLQCSLNGRCSSSVQHSGQLHIKCTPGHLCGGSVLFESLNLLLGSLLFQLP